MLKILKAVVTDFEQNCRILYIPGNSDAVVVDPGGDPDLILETLRKHELNAKQIFLTHSHLDHCGGVRKVKESTRATLYAHPLEAQMREHVTYVARVYGLDPQLFEDCPEPEVLLTGGEELQVLGLRMQVLFTPGHSPGHLSFYFPAAKILISGDCVFAGSIGRTDLPGGDSELLFESIRSKILTLDDDTRILSGHGPDTTVSEERAHNPFLCQKI